MTTLLYKAAGEIRGDDILPLNALRVHYPDLYERHFAKYADRLRPVLPRGCRRTRHPVGEGPAPLRNLNATEPLYPWADIPHVLHRGPIPLAAFRTSARTPVVTRRIE